MTTEQVLVIPTAAFRKLGYFQGINHDIRYRRLITDQSICSYRPRDQMETDPEFKQLIPYCVFMYRDRIFTYRRSKQQGENRLHGKLAIGVGGHVCDSDDAGAKTYLRGMSRELAEEVIIDAPVRDTIFGFINDDSNDVGRVHLGIVHQIKCDSPGVRPREAAMLEAGFVTMADLRHRYFDELEIWSQMIIRSMTYETAASDKSGAD